MSAYDIQGKNAIFQLDLDANGFKDLVCVKTWSLNSTIDTVETTSDGDGQSIYLDYFRKGYQISLTGLVQILTGDSRPTFLNLFDAQQGFLPVAWRILCIDDSGNPLIFEGQCLNTNNLIDKAQNNLLGGSVTLQGTGPLVKVVPDLSNTVVFQLDSSNFVSNNALTAGYKTYKLPYNTFAIVVTSAESSAQQVTAQFTVPKLGGASYGVDYGHGISVGITNPTFVGVDDGFGSWVVTVTFDYTPATLNKVLKIATA